MDSNTPTISPINPPSSQSTPVVIHPSGHKFNYLFLVIPLALLLIVIIFFIVIKIYFPNLFSGSSNIQTEQKTAEGNQLPVSLSEKSINDVSVLYELKGNVQQVSHEGDNIKLVLDTQAEGIPNSFIYHPMARLFYSTEDRSSFKPATIDNIQAGQQVILGTDYILKSNIWDKNKNTWRLLYVHIIKPKNFFESSSSGILNPPR